MQKERARRREAVHQRITKAAVHLHGSVGPARTTVSDIARRAGVRRATVYNHFATDRELFEACSSHWFAEHPPPSPSQWSPYSDSSERIRTALEELYGYYHRGRKMLGNVLRDAPQVPALQEILRLKWQPWFEIIVSTLAQGWDNSDPKLVASLRVALDFFTWQRMADSGLTDREAARLAASWVEAAAHKR